jgi:methionyl-tRNA formyltransferase
MHGSLLPRYRGRAPVNWAVLHGERETGATLHYMTEKPDAGDIVAQTTVPILPDDTAREVFDKVTLAAEITLDSALPALRGDRARIHKAAQASCFGGRKPEDGTIDWFRPAKPSMTSCAPLPALSGRVHDAEWRARADPPDASGRCRGAADADADARGA